MSKFKVKVGWSEVFRCGMEVDVDAETLDEALARAIEEAYDTDRKHSREFSGYEGWQAREVKV